MTIKATAPMSASLSKPKSIMRRQATASRPGLGFDVDRVRVVRRRRTGDLLRRLRGGVGGAVTDAVLEALDRAAEVGADVLQLLGAEDQHDDQQHDQPMPDAERSHDEYSKAGTPAILSREGGGHPWRVREEILNPSPRAAVRRSHGCAGAAPPVRRPRRC